MPTGAPFQIADANGNQSSVSVHASDSSRPVPTILALHGFTGSGEDFMPLRDALGHDRAHWVCLDFMGHGNSDCPEDPSAYSIESTLGQIARALELAPNPGNVLLLGYSMGARIGLHYLLENPGMGAILISGSPGIADENERDKRIQSDRDWIRMLKDPTMGIEAFCAAWETQAVIQPQTRLPAPLAMQLKLRRRNNSPVGLANSLTAVGTGALPSLWGRLDQLPGIQLVTGEQDMKFRRIAQEMTSLNPQFQTWVIPESGHSPHLEQPHRLARDLRLFI